MRYVAVICFYLASLAPTMAWRPLHDPYRATLSVLKSSSSDDHIDVEAIRARLEDTYSHTYSDGDDSVFLEYDALFRLREDSSQIRLPLESPEETSDDWMDESVMCGEECDQECQIPPEFKSLIDPALDVMSFLGIHRAQPIRVERRPDDWE